MSKNNKQNTANVSNGLRLELPNKVMPKMYINVGCLMDIPTSSLTIGIKGETIYNGGLGPISAIIGTGNNYKSTILHYMMLKACDNTLESGYESGMTTYDTEVNISLDRLEKLANSFSNLNKHNDIIGGENSLWSVYDKSSYSANSWAVGLNDYLEQKKDNKSLLVEYEAIKDPYNKENKVLKKHIPTFVEIDSLSEFEPDSTIEMLSSDLDSSDTNTYAMKQGLFKTKFISRLPVLSNSTNTYFLLTGQIGKSYNISTPMNRVPVKTLQYLNVNDSIKGVSSKFIYLLSILWYAHTATLLKNQNTGLAEYPIDGNDMQATDLNTVKLTQLRNKNGPSGYTVSIVISQNEGVLPTLTEFHYIKENNRFGLEGNNVNYKLVLYPDINLSRTTIREKINKDNKLRRAINITAELLQLQIFHGLELGELICSPEELYNDIKSLGYDWNELLDTRGYWTINQYSNPIKYLSTVDLLKMRKGLYTPYWK